jgi:hypothetical protein
MANVLCVSLGLFNDAEWARRALAALKAVGFESEDIVLLEPHRRPLQRGRGAGSLWIRPACPLAVACGRGFDRSGSRRRRHAGGPGAAPRAGGPEWEFAAGGADARLCGRRGDRPAPPRRARRAASCPRFQLRIDPRIQRCSKVGSIWSPHAPDRRVHECRARRQLSL